MALRLFCPDRIDIYPEGYPKKKPLGGRTKTNNKLNPHRALSPGIEPGPHWWEASALTTALLFVRLLVYDMYDLKKLKPLDPSKRVDCGAVRIHWSSPMTLRRTKKVINRRLVPLVREIRNRCNIIKPFHSKR